MSIYREEHIPVIKVSALEIGVLNEGLPDWRIMIVQPLIQSRIVKTPLRKSDIVKRGWGGKKNGFKVTVRS